MATRSNDSEPPPFLSPHPDGATIRIKVQPRASRTELAGILGDRLKIRVAGPPVEGKANTELLKFLAKRLRVPKSALALSAGATGRLKTVMVRGKPATEVAEALDQKNA